MENELFTWKGWDQQNILSFTYYKVTLVKAIGVFPAGTTFDYADIDYEKGTLSFSVDDGPMVKGHGKIKEVARFKIGINITAIMPIEEY